MRVNKAQKAKNEKLGLNTLSLEIPAGRESEVSILLVPVVILGYV